MCAHTLLLKPRDRGPQVSVCACVVIMMLPCAWIESLAICARMSVVVLGLFVRLTVFGASYILGMCQMPELV